MTKKEMKAMIKMYQLQLEEWQEAYSNLQQFYIQERAGAKYIETKEFKALHKEYNVESI